MRSGVNVPADRGGWNFGNHCTTLPSDSLCSICQPCPRWNDSTIMATLMQHNIQERTLLRMNRCRNYLNVLFLLSKIRTADGKYWSAFPLYVTLTSRFWFVVPTRTTNPSRLASREVDMVRSHIAIRSITVSPWRMGEQTIVKMEMDTPTGEEPDCQHQKWYHTHLRV